MSYGTLAAQIIQEHLIEGDTLPGTTLALRIDQTLTQDATGTLAYLQFEALGLPQIRADLAVSYIDHNMLQTGFENADDHRFLRTAAARFGAHFSRPGNGICHQVHLERFAVPGQTLLGSDSHTPTSGGMGMLAIGAGGLDVALAMAGEPFRMTMPTVVGVHLTGTLSPWVASKDVILQLLRGLSVRGGRDRIFEYTGIGVHTLSVPERATITNMGAELGATTSLFPSDEQTRQYLVAQGRGESWRLLTAAPGVIYDEEIHIDLSALGPLVACPGSPDSVVGVRQVAGTPIEQVAIGSCTNSSYHDLAIVASILEGHTVHPNVSLVITPGSRQAFLMAEKEGLIAVFLRAGARILESACGPCIGMGQAPASGSASLRSFNRNFPGRAGTPGAGVYLASPEVCAASALTGHITDPRTLGRAYPIIPAIPETYLLDDTLIIPPLAAEAAAQVVIVRGPNIAPLPLFDGPPGTLTGPVLLAVGDDVSTDDIMPAGAKVLPLRSNIPALSAFAFSRLDPGYADRARAQGGDSFIVAGRNYGQGSSREHAALVPRYLGVRAVIAQSFSRIHADNLVNFGILPLTLGEEDNLTLVRDSVLTITDLPRQLGRPDGQVLLTVAGRTAPVVLRHTLTPRQCEIVIAGGLLNYALRTPHEGVEHLDLHQEPAVTGGPR